MSAGTRSRARSIRHGCPPAGWWQLTPGPLGWLKKMKSASERTLPLAVTSSAERSAACATCTVTRNCRVASDMFWPLTSAVLNVPPSGHRDGRCENPTAPAALTDRPMRMCSLGDVRNLVCTYLLPVPLHDLVAGGRVACGGRATVRRRESGGV